MLSSCGLRHSSRRANLPRLSAVIAAKKERKPALSALREAEVLFTIVHADMHSGGQPF